MRAIRPEDEPLIIDLHGRHSEQTIRMRFFSLVKTLSRDSLIRLCHLDYDREMALAAVQTKGEQSMILGVSRYYLHPETGAAEFALVVERCASAAGTGPAPDGAADRDREGARREEIGRPGAAREYPDAVADGGAGVQPPVTVDNDVVKVEKELIHVPGESVRSLNGFV